VGTIAHNVVLNFTDLTGDKTGCVTLGSNKFWKGHVVDHGNGTADFECKWGPTGEPGSDKGSKRGISLAEAIKILNSKVAEKEKKGYTRLQVRDDAEEAAKQAAKGIVAAVAPGIAAAPAPKRIFHPEVGKLLSTIYGATSTVVRAGLSSQAGATASNPIGNLSDSQLDIGGSILDEIGLALEAEFGRESTNNKATTFPLAKDGTPSPKVIDLTNRFMSNVPREIGREMRGRENLHRLVISSYERLQAQREFLQLLRDAHLTQAVFQAAGAQTASSDKEAVWYDGLNCAIEHLDPASPEFRRVVEIFSTGQSQKNSNWFRNGRSTLRVANVFKYCRNGTESTFSAYADKVARKPGAVGKIMAWHGTKAENTIGISKQGLLMPENLPRGVSQTGKAFGKGIYHAPNFLVAGVKTVGPYPTDGTNGALKSMNYTGMSGAAYGGGNAAAYMFLQEVALGKADVHFSACWDKHRPNDFPNNDFIFACGAKNQGGFVHDEIVTFDQNAQKFAYLLLIKSV